MNRRLLMVALLFLSGVIFAQDATIIYHLEPVMMFPDNQSPVAALPNQYTPVTLIGRYDEWVHIQARDSLWTGWVKVDALETTYDLESLPIETIEPIDILENLHYWNFKPTLHNIYLYGENLGNRIDVFSKVGDSITVNFAFLQPFGKGIHYLGEEFAYLETALNFFNVDESHPTTSYTQPSRAAQVGWNTSDILAPDDHYLCERGDNRLMCEYRLRRPSIALIMLGTNDVRSTSPEKYEKNMRRIIEISLERGVVPVISTIPAQIDYDDRVMLFNLTLIKLADEYDVPLWNYWLAMQSLPNRGLSEDGVHPSAPASGAGTTIFTEANLEYGFTLRNLMALEVLHLLLHNMLNG